MKTAIQIGCSYTEYEEMTPYELSVAVEAFLEMAEMQAQEQLTYVWLGEYYHRIKHLPNLKDVLKISQPNQPKAMTDEEMKKVAMRLNAQFGGTFEKGEVNEREESTPNSL